MTRAVDSGRALLDLLGGPKDSSNFQLETYIDWCHDRDDYEEYGRGVAHLRRHRDEAHQGEQN